MQEQVQIHCEKNSCTTTKYLENLSQVQSSTSNATFVFHNGESQSDENTKAAVLCFYSLFMSMHTIMVFSSKHEMFIYFWLDCN